MSNDKVQSIMALASNYALSVASGLDTDEECEAHRAALESAIREAIAAPGVAQGWQPIESAPKDGTSILAFWPPSNRQPVHGGCYGVAMWSDCNWCNPEDDEDDYIDPSHWMPLPAAPSPTAEQRPPYCGSGHCSCIECPYGETNER